jgi:hypothetical protein
VLVKAAPASVYLIILLIVILLHWFFWVVIIYLGTERFNRREQKNWFTRIDCTEICLLYWTHKNIIIPTQKMSFKNWSFLYLYQSCQNVVSDLNCY